MFGNLEPKSGMLVPPESFDVMLVPLVAFDNSFNRLGYGQGYYDNYLSLTNCFKLGVAFGWQLVSNIEVSSHDIKLDSVVSCI